MKQMNLLAHVGRNVELSTGCIVGAACSLTEPETIPENTIIYGSNNHRRNMSDKPYVSFKLFILFIYFQSDDFFNFTITKQNVLGSTWSDWLPLEGTSELPPST